MVSENKAIVIFKNYVNMKSVDLELPLDITANDLIRGLNKAYSLGININDPSCCFLKSEHPLSLIKGDKTLESLGICNGTVIYYNPTLE